MNIRSLLSVGRLLPALFLKQKPSTSGLLHTNRLLERFQIVTRFSKSLLSSVTDSSNNTNQISTEVPQEEDEDRDSIIMNTNFGMKDVPEQDDGFVVRVRGLPWSANLEDIHDFMKECNIPGGTTGIHLTYNRDGRPSGEAFIELDCEEDLQSALTKNNDHMGKRYIEVFRSKRSEMEWVVKRAGTASQSASDAVVRLRGLPFGCSKEEICEFFTGFQIAPNGITLIQDRPGHSTGDAYVQFASPALAESALSKHKEKIGHRYIEIFKSSLAEARAAMGMPRQGMMRGGMGGMGRPGPYDRGDRFGGGIGMGGGMGGMGRRGGGGRNIKGFYDEYDDYGDSGMMGMGGMRRGRGSGMGGGRGGRGGFGGGGGGFGSRDGGMGDGLYQSQTGHSVHMRGLPFQAIEQDILEFFRGLNPVNVVIHYMNDGRASGESDVDFATHDEAKEAMKKDKSMMQHRYIELFLSSTPGGGLGGGGGGGNYNNGSFGAMGGGANLMGNPNYTAF